MNKLTSIAVTLAALDSGFDLKQCTKGQYLVYKTSGREYGIVYWNRGRWVNRRADAQLMSPVEANAVADREGGKAVKR